MEHTQLKTIPLTLLGPIYTFHFSRVKYNSSPTKLAEIALNQQARTNSKVEHVASIVYCNVVESSNTSEISAAWITFDVTEMRCINWTLVPGP